MGVGLNICRSWSESMVGKDKAKGSRHVTSGGVEVAGLLTCVWIVLAMQIGGGQLRVCFNSRGRDLSYFLQVHVS